MKDMANMEQQDRGTVLLCEDEPIVALDVKMMIEDAGYRVAGPFARVDKALESLDGDFVAAVLDVRLRDGDVFPVAECLHKRGVPLIFHSGHIIENDVASRFPSAKHCPKPIDSCAIRAALKDLDGVH